MYAPAVHNHDTAPMPRWVRWTAFVVIAQTLLLAGVILVLLRQEQRQDATDQIISQRAAVRDAQRTEDEERERLRLCELILVLPPDFTARGDLLGQLSCPPAGDPAYNEAPDVPTTAPGAMERPTSAGSSSPTAAAPTAASRTSTTPTPTATTGATETPAPTASTQTAGTTTPATSAPSTSASPAPTSGDGGLPGQLCVPLVGCLDL